MDTNKLIVIDLGDVSETSQHEFFEAIVEYLDCSDLNYNRVNAMEGVLK